MLLTACMAATNTTITLLGSNDVPVAKDKSVTETVMLLKEQGCNALPPLQHNLLILLIVAKFPDYPANGLCDPNWVNEVLVKQIDKLSEQKLDPMTDETLVNPQKSALRFLVRGTQ